MRASNGSFLARTPLAMANCRSLQLIDLAHGQVGREQGTHSATLVATARLDPIVAIEQPRSCSISSAQPATSLDYDGAMASTTGTIATIRGTS
jgi:hypothetical protein